MLYVIAWNQKTDRTKAYAFNNYNEYICNTFNPGHEIICIIDTEKPPKGKSYDSKKDTLMRQAFHYRYISNKLWIDQKPITDYFTRYGKRYGLLKEFKQNGII